MNETEWCGYCGEVLVIRGRRQADGDYHSTAHCRERLSEKVETLEANLADRDATILRLSKWIADHGPSIIDHACAECLSHGEILVEGFRCGRHVALAALAALAPTPGPVDTIAVPRLATNEHDERAVDKLVADAMRDQKATRTIPMCPECDSDARYCTRHVQQSGDAKGEAPR